MLSMGEESGGRPPLPRVFFRDEETARNAFKQAHAANGHGVPGAQPWQAPGPSTPGLGFHLPLLPHGASDRAGNPSESHNGTFYGAPPPGASTWPPSTAAAPAFGHGSPRNPRKRAWDEDTETEKADQLNGSVSSEDAMMTDDMSPQLQALPSLDSLPSGTNHGRQEDHETGLFMHGAHTAHGVGEGGMLGRFKRVRMNDGPDDGR